MRKGDFKYVLIAGLLLVTLFGWIASKNLFNPKSPEPNLVSAEQIPTSETLPDAPEHPSPALIPIPEDAGFSAKDSAIIKSIHGQFATGNFVGALNIADQHLTDRATSDPLHKWITDQLQALLTSAGWTKLRLGDCDEAIGLFRRANVIQKSIEATKGLALCHYKQKNFASAREYFDSFLEKNPNDIQMRILLTDVLESEGRYDQAVGILEKTVNALESKTIIPDEQLPDV